MTVDACAVYHEEDLRPWISASARWLKDCLVAHTPEN